MAGQVALTVPLLVGAGLLLHTFLHLWNMSSGFDGSHVLTARFSMQDARYATPEKMTQFFDAVTTRLHETPGIDSVAVSLTLPYERGLNWGVKLPGDSRDRITDFIYATPEFFTALRIPVLRGRVFNVADGTHASSVAVVNQAFVDRYFKDRNPLGQPLSIADAQREIVGVVGNVLVSPAGWGGRTPVTSLATVYIPAAQTSEATLKAMHTWFSPDWIVRSTLPETQVRSVIEGAVRSADPLLPVAEFRGVD